MLVKIFALLIFLNLSNCHFFENLALAKVIENTRKIRDAEKIYRQRFEKFGTIKELSDRNLLDSSLADGFESNYKFILKLENDHYYLIVIPENDLDKTKNEELSLYVDDSGVIRASTDSEVTANLKSSPIAEQ